MSIHMNYKKHYAFYRFSTRFAQPVLEGSYNGLNWTLVSLLDSFIDGKVHKHIWEDPSGVAFCCLCGSDVVPGEPELHEGRCTANV